MTTFFARNGDTITTLNGAAFESALPLGTYSLQRNPQTGQYYLSRVGDLSTSGKLYGPAGPRADRIFNTFTQRAGTTGVLLDGLKGTGKTEAIVQLTSTWSGGRTLILTHTLAGVAALRRRLQAARVPTDRYSLSSIDAWCVRRVGGFPMRAGPLPDAANPRVFYPAVRAACLRLLTSHSLDAALRSTYGRVFVDEYQDCGPEQHAIVCQLAELLPTFVFGDPLQAVFNFPDRYRVCPCYC